MTQDKVGCCFMSTLAGVLFGNVGWLLPSAVERGGWNVVVCLIFTVLGLFLLAGAVSLLTEGS